MRLWLVCSLAACSRNASAPPPAPVDDHQIHVTTTQEPNGVHIIASGKGVAVKDLKLPPALLLPVVGTLDVSLDLHVPDNDYRRATGEGSARCATGCAIAFQVTPGVDPTALPPNRPIDTFEARVVFSHGAAEITQWTVEAKDLRFVVSGRLELARAFEDSVATMCVRLGTKDPAQVKKGSEVEAILARMNIAIDADGMESFKLHGKFSELESVDYGCDGQTRPPPPPAPITPVPVIDDSGIVAHGDTAFDLPRALLAQFLANPMGLAKSTRLVPVMKNGKAHGFKIFAIEPGSTVAKLGIRNGDTLLAVAGHDLTRADDALVVFSDLHDLKVGQTVTLAIERSTVPTPIVYTIR